MIRVIVVVTLTPLILLLQVQLSLLLSLQKCSSFHIGTPSRKAYNHNHHYHQQHQYIFNQQFLERNDVNNVIFGWLLSKYVVSTCCYAVKKSKSQDLTKSTSTSIGSGGGTTRSGFGSTKSSSTSTSSNKNKKKKKKKLTTTITNDNNNNNDDYAIFPPLDNDIIKTMIRSVPILFDESGELPDELYQRLDQIYGFPNFNYQVDTEQEEKEKENVNNNTTTTFSFQELITETSKSSSMDPLLGFFGTTTTTNNNNIGTDNDTILSDYKCLQKIKEFTQFRVLHIDPMVLAIDNFFTNDECDQYVQMSTNDNNNNNNKFNDGTANNNSNTKINNRRQVMSSQSPTIGKDSYAKSQRTSTTFYHPYENVPELLAKATRLLGLQSINQWEEPQTVRYSKNEKFTWHLDALGPLELEQQKQQQQSNTKTGQSAGQRLATLLVYLTDMSLSTDGGATIFRDLRGVGTTLQQNQQQEQEQNNNNDYLTVQPKKGTALLFFPAAGGIQDTPYDIRTIHCGQCVNPTAVNDKWIAQLWLREKSYQPSAPPGNNHLNAYPAITNYCNSIL